MNAMAAVELHMDPHAQFIYELALAHLELRALGVLSEPNATLRLFRAGRPVDPEKLARRAAYIVAIDRVQTVYARLRQYNRTASVNQYLSHWFYPYKGKFHPQMVRALLNIMQLEPGNTVLDPFIGSGTTALEAQLLGIRCIGVDISPVCTLVARVKTDSWRVLERVLAYRDQYEVIARAAEKAGVRLHLPAEEISDDDRVWNFFKVAELIAHSDRARRDRPFIESHVANIKRMAISTQDMLDARAALGLHFGTADIRQGDARNLPLETGSVDGIVTSPPYAVTLDYIENDAHALRALGYNPLTIRENFIGVRGNRRDRMDLYLDDMRRCCTEMYRVLRAGCWLTLIIGNGTSEARAFDLPALSIDMCSAAGFEYVRTIEKPMRGRYGDSNAESILMFIKPPMGTVQVR
ncbi:MAG: hypothetical protein FJY97_07610 [candidate division Zixibacteria bacterium]|nr:hypothetical protein [candidate division Zixibacteria bacterium]